MMFSQGTYFTEHCIKRVKNWMKQERKSLLLYSLFFAGNLAPRTQKLPGNRIREYVEQVCKEGEWGSILRQGKLVWTLQRELIDMAGQQAPMCHHMAGESRTDCSAIPQKPKPLKYHQTSIHGIYQDIQAVGKERSENCRVNWRHGRGWPVGDTND